MDESWRMRTGTSTALPCRKSTADTSMVTPKGRLFFGPEDFSDVFGGPPQVLRSPKFSGDFVSPSFYEEIFLQPEFDYVEAKSARSLPAFRIPASKDGFYNDIFGSEKDVHRSRERSAPNSKDKSKSKSSSVLSSEELSPCRPVLGDGVTLSSLASKLRPLKIPYRWSSAATRAEEQRQKQPYTPPFHYSHSSSNMEDETYSDNFRSPYYYGFSRHIASPETMDLEDPLSSPDYSICQEAQRRAGDQDHEAEEEEDEVMSSYVIEISSDQREESGEAVSVDEAIAWAKETYHGRSSKVEESNNNCFEGAGRLNEHKMAEEKEGHRVVQSPEEVANQWKAELKQKSDEQIEMALLDEDIKLWSSGKENNIKLLLSTLHQILWPNSGWQPFPITNLTGSSQVKKAYQKAMLCLHPDKLQQRGAKHAQKYVAEKAFSILQDAWDVSISQNLFNSGSS